MQWCQVCPQRVKCFSWTSIPSSFVEPQKLASFIFWFSNKLCILKTGNFTTLNSGSDFFKFYVCINIITLTTFSFRNWSFQVSLRGTLGCILKFIRLYYWKHHTHTFRNVYNITFSWDFWSMLTNSYVSLDT